MVTRDDAPDFTIISSHNFGPTPMVASPARYERAAAGNCPNGCGALEASTIKGMLRCATCCTLVWKSNPFEKARKA